MITGYNGNRQPVRNLFYTVQKEIRLQGFIVGTLIPKYRDAFYAEVPGLIAQGRIKYKEDAKTGLGLVCEALLDVQTGKNRGKSIIILND